MTEMLDALVTRLVESPWPTTEPERREWADRVGLPVDGEMVPEVDRRMPSTASFRANGDGLEVHWHFYRDAFTGVGLFASAEDDDALGRDAQALRTAWGARWALADEASDDRGGFMACWEADDKCVELYWHAPDLDPRGHPIRGCLQIAVSHAERAAAQEHEARARLAQPGG